jgi:hypothetical protein
VDQTLVPCPEILLRALIKAGWVDEETGEIKADAFIRNPARDPDGLSVNIDRLTDRATWLSSFRACFGADSLHAGRIRTLGIDIVQTARDMMSDPAHALIVGIPSQEEDALTAERLASSLRDMCRSVDRIKRKQRR